MSSPWTTARKTWTIIGTVVATVMVMLLAQNFMRPEKNLERKIEHQYAVADSQFRLEMAVMMGPTIHSGNHITAYQNGAEIFPAMLEAIRGARESITFETFIYWSGEIGSEFADALIERATAGVPVHVLVDWVGSSKMEVALLTRLDEAGVQLHRYRPLRWYNLRRMNNRSHRKLLVVDGRTGFTGGVGIADLWNGRATDPEHWRDSHYRVDGPAVAQLQAAFNDNWIKTTGEVLHGPRYFMPLEPAGAMDAHVVIASPSGGAESMHLMYLMAIAASVTSIDISASYFVPDALIMKALLAARERGVRIRILVPGKHIDSELVRLMSKASWGDLLQAGIEVYEYQPTMLHAKLMVIDRHFVSVGSTNFDIRSFRLNDEASLNVYDPGFAEALSVVFEADLEPTVRYTYEMWEARPFIDKVGERLVWPIRSQL